MPLPTYFSDVCPSLVIHDVSVITNIRIRFKYYHREIKQRSSSI